MSDVTGLTHECGIVGCIATGDWPANLDVAEIICVGLVALQHRGQESAGIVTGTGSNKNFNIKKGTGLIGNIFNDDNIRQLKGNIGIGHTRYSTMAGSGEVNCQPFVVHNMHGVLAIAHNGEISNAPALRKMVLSRGVGLSTHSDSELISQALCLNPPEKENLSDGPNWSARIKHLMKLAPLSYSLLVMEKDRMYAVRDPYGNRPLCIGKILPLDNKDNAKEEGWVVSSESCSFLSIGAKFVREVRPGEIIEFTRRGPQTICIVDRPEGKNAAFCIFEYVYFARADSILEGQMVYSARMQCGVILAQESLVEADIVSSIPESGTAAAYGFSKQSGIPFAEVLYKNRYIGRTFIQPNERLRRIGTAKKFGALTENIKGKRIILIDDSIVRGNTIGPIIKLIRDAGAKEVHIRVASPPLRYPCYMGINIPTSEELIANQLNTTELASCNGADSLAYLSVNGLLKAITHGIKNKDNEKSSGHCTACLTGKYPVNLDW